MANYCLKNPVGVTLSVIGGKWKPLILWLLHEKTRRFSELKREIPEISQKMLTSELRELEKDRLIKRKIYPVIPPKVEYSMTDYGLSLCPLLKQMAQWGEAHLKVATSDGSERPVSLAE